ncbi:MAG: NAD-dependent epimerase/dehydratase family protein [Bauldia sp.]|uniref:NAD-dependent epimerase/dehydratase family protein n=1 Tax=Bauldia sp. TaxID=2575872 RepID=UPI001D50831A|nr:NAD-dependent epimerase/dehydratase family protein [Bauldia sp.]MCB1496477.1 NAD-dependent epimerase/dehydratase family protein [Bauldia sp.]
MPDLHVVFGAGPVGRALVDELAARGEAVRLVSRKPVAGLPAGVAHAAGDASSSVFAQVAAAGATTVYQCLSPPYSRWADLFPPLQHSVVAAAREAGARYVSFENVYLYGDTRGAPMTEDAPVRPTTRKGTVRAAMANELARLAAAGDLEVATARASDYFGPRATFQSPLGSEVTGRAVAGKSARLLGDPDQPHSFTFLGDAARVLATLGTDSRAAGGVWHVPNAPARTQREIVAMIAGIVGHDVGVAPTPRWLLRLLGLFVPDIRALDEMRYEFTQPFVVDGSRFTGTFGIEATPLADSIRATVDWWRDRDPAAVRGYASS